MSRSTFEDSRISEGTRERDTNPRTAPEYESSAISRDDVRDGFAAPGTAAADTTENATKLTTNRRRRRVLTASTVTGDRVRNAAGEDLGKIEEIMLDLPTGRIAYAVLSFGGFIGLGDKLFAIPWSALRIDEGEHEFILDIDRATLDRAPGFDKDNWPDMADDSFATSIHRHYGQAPYWEHDVTDSGDYAGDNHQPNRSIEYEQTIGFRPGGK